jgi:RNA polymerase sigma-70 factor (ECF subfamily)
MAELHSLLHALFDARSHPVPATASGVGAGTSPAPDSRDAEWLLQASHQEAAKTRAHGAHIAFERSGIREPAEDTGTTRIVALVELAKRGDAEAFGQLYDHYLSTVYRYVYYRVGAHALAEDLASETFLRALRSLSSFHWQGRDFGAWLVTIARNLVTDHFKSGRFRLEVATGEILDFDSAADGPEDDVLARLTNEALVKALRQLRADQQECLVLRFLNGLSVAETAHVLGKSDGAVKQLQLRAVRNLAKLLPEGIR